MLKGRSIATQKDEAQQLKLPGGRILSFEQHGNQDGQPVLFFHGTPGSRLDWGLFENDGLLDRLGIHLIAIDRPGMGFSTFQAGRHFLDWPQDILCLADALDLSYFSALGYSSGGAYALACANEIPERIARVGVVSGDGPYYLPGLVDGLDPLTLWYLRLSLKSPSLYRLSQQVAKWAAQSAPSLFLTGFRSQLPEADRVIFSQTRVQRTLIATLRESMRHGTHGAQWDAALMVGQWDFDPQSIPIPVYLWYGEADHSTSPAMGHYLAEEIPRGIAHFYPNEGHLSLLANHTEEILRTLTI